MAQRAGSLSASSGNPQERIALAGRPETSARPARLACAPLAGQVFEPNGRELVGATLLLKGTHQAYVTDSEGKFQLTDNVYQGQTLTVQAAGYITQDISLDDCTLPRLVLEKDPTAHIKRAGKRVGQVTRLNNRSTELK
jgi:hypothetical protein